jgi:hypothetical protein
MFSYAYDQLQVDQGHLQLVNASFICTEMVKRFLADRQVWLTNVGFAYS